MHISSMGQELEAILSLFILRKLQNKQIGKEAKLVSLHFISNYIC